MSSSTKSLSSQGLTLQHLIYLLLSIGMVAVSIYLTVHFFETHFPTGIAKTSGLCDINEFWGCDKTTLSPLGSIMTVPTSFFGVVMGLIGIIGALWGQPEVESTNKLLVYLNAAGCLALLVYSLAALDGLCPMCTVYYILSWLAAFMFFKYSELPLVPSFKPLVLYFVITLIGSLALANNFKSKKELTDNLGSQYQAQFAKLKDLGDPDVESSFKIHQPQAAFGDAPIRISVFSDLECPFCHIVSQQMEELAEEFKDKISIQYYAFPLDNSCNPDVKRVFHQNACKAAMLAFCDPTKFKEIHDFIFQNQKQLSFENLKKWEKKFGLSGCFDNTESEAALKRHHAISKKYNVKSTPVIVINGKKIEGTIPTQHFKSILKGIVEKQ